MNTDAIAVTLLVTETFEELGVPHMIGGSLASSLRGVPRASLDGDIVAALDGPRVAEVCRRLNDAFYLAEEAVRDAVRRCASFNLVHFATAFKVDVFVCGTRPFDLEELARRKHEVVCEEPRCLAWVKTAEDVVLTKLEWYRRGGELSDRQWSDVVGVLRVQGETIDAAYLRRWAPELRIADLLERALAEAKRETT